MYTIRAIWEGELLHQVTAFSETIAYERFQGVVDQHTYNSGVSIQLIDDQNNVLTEYYIV